MLRLVRVNHKHIVAAARHDDDGGASATLRKNVGFDCRVVHIDNCRYAPAGAVGLHIAVVVDLRLANPRAV